MGWHTGAFILSTLSHVALYYNAYVYDESKQEGYTNRLALKVLNPMIAVNGRQVNIPTISLW